MNKGKKIVSADSDDFELEKLDQDEGADSLDEEKTKSLCEWLKEKLGDKVSRVETGSSSTVLLVL